MYRSIYMANLDFYYLDFFKFELGLFSLTKKNETGSRNYDIYRYICDLEAGEEDET